MNMNFNAVAYRGKFRKDQTALLSKVHHRSDNKKIHILTPPGSDKVALGLEIIRYIGAPALILSGTAAFCQRWGDRFVTDFLPDDEQDRRDAYMSLSLTTPALVTAITYGTFADAFSQTGSRIERAEGEERADVIQYVHSCGIRTILLDDPHHVGDTYLSALESFFGVLGSEVKVLTMDSVLPYDIKAPEWMRYEALCGDLDTEIRLTDLVKNGTLAPHQDYVYMNYPTESESEGIFGYRLRADMAVDAVMQLPFIEEINQRLVKLHRQSADYMEQHRSSLGALLCLLAEYGNSLNPALVKAIHGRKKAPSLTAEIAEDALQFLSDSHSILKNAEREELNAKLSEFRVLEDHRVRLTMTGKIRRTLRSSLGKLDSMAAIIETEHRAFGDQSRTLIVTDSLRADELNLAGTTEAPAGIGMISIFETMRRRFTDLPIGCVSKEAVILPLEVASSLSHDLGSSFHTVPLGDTGYAFYQFSESDEMLDTVQAAFKAGYIRVLIGGAYDLSGLWEDLSLVRTLIIASRHVDFSTIYDLRGRVLYKDGEESDKVAHIWHLATVERMYSLSENAELRLASRSKPGDAGRGDFEFEALRRYFTCFVGPNETGPSLVSGIHRVGDIHLPQDPADLDAMNAAMCALAADRTRLAAQWNEFVRVEETMTTAYKKPRYGKTHMVPEVYIPKTSRLPVFTLEHTLVSLLAVACIAVFGCMLLPLFVTFCYLAYVLVPSILGITIAFTAVFGLITLWGVLFVFHLLPLLPHLIPRYSIRVRCKAVFKAMRALDLVDKKAVFAMQKSADGCGYRVFIYNCSSFQQMSYALAVSEIFSTLESPRYFFVRSGWIHRYLWKWSCNCPAVIAKNDISVKVFARHIRMAMGMVKFHYTGREAGRKYLYFARNSSYLNTSHARCERRVRQIWVAGKKGKKKKRNS